MPAAISTAMIAATTQSTTMQNGGHQRVPATKWLRCCQRSLSPWPARPATSSHGDPVTAAAATTTNPKATLLSAAMILGLPSAAAKPTCPAAIAASPSVQHRRAVESPERQRRRRLEEADRHPAHSMGARTAGCEATGALPRWLLIAAEPPWDPWASATALHRPHDVADGPARMGRVAPVVYERLVRRARDGAVNALGRQPREVVLLTGPAGLGPGRPIPEARQPGRPVERGRHLVDVVDELGGLLRRPAVLRIGHEARETHARQRRHDRRQPVGAGEGVVLVPPVRAASPAASATGGAAELPIRPRVWALRPGGRTASGRTSRAHGHSMLPAASSARSWRPRRRPALEAFAEAGGRRAAISPLRAVASVVGAVGHRRAGSRRR